MGIGILRRFYSRFGFFLDGVVVVITITVGVRVISALEQVEADPVLPTAASASTESNHCRVGLRQLDGFLGFLLLFLLLFLFYEFSLIKFFPGSPHLLDNLRFLGFLFLTDNEPAKVRGW